MLLKYKTDYQKIAMGLLSFIPDLKDLTRLKQELDWYEGSDTRNLYLWKNENNDFVGIIGIEVDDQFILVRQLSFSPNERHQGHVFQVLDELSRLFPDKKVMGTFETTPLIAKWEHKSASSV